ncbi:Fe-S oxidoreductase [Duganella sp. Leaf126]|nr:Fe-S oxidoreductase [Duganella sp. Leaf126]
MSAPTNPLQFPSNRVPSPCVSLCKMDAERQYCTGCLRTLDEIMAWSTADEAYKQAVWVAIGRRRETVSFDEDGFQK